MRWRNTRANWGAVAKILHWLIAIAIIGNMALGLYAAGLPLSPAQMDAFYWHKTTGLTILGLVMLRILWRLANPAPQLPPTMPGWQRIAAHFSHFALYLLMIAMPVSGWVIHSASGFPMELYGLFEVPDIVPESADESAVQDGAAVVHYWLFMGLCVLVSLHVLAALKHHFVNGDTVLVRMLPFSRASDPIRGE